MRRSNFTDDEIAMWLLDADQGVPIEDICRSVKISVRTFYRWRERFGSLPPKAIRHVRDLEDENRALKHTLKLASVSPATGLGEALRRNEPGLRVTMRAASTRVASAYRTCRSS